MEESSDPPSAVNDALLLAESFATEEWEEEFEWDDEETDYDPFDYVSIHCDRLGYYEAPLYAPTTFTTPPVAQIVEQQLLPLPEILTTQMTPLSERRKDEPYLIIPGLYLGAESHAKHEYMLTRLGITHILGIHENAKRHFPQSFDYCLFNLKDRQESDISKLFSDAHSFIRKAHENQGIVFVHCWAGMSRSATLVITYLMQLEKISFNEAYKRVAMVKPDIRPNEGFVFQMRQYEKLLDINGNANTAAKKSSRQGERERKPSTSKQAVSWLQATSSSATISKGPKAQRGGSRRAAKS